MLHPEAVAIVERLAAVELIRNLDISFQHLVDGRLGYKLPALEDALVQKHL
jgi:hypothetical protein